MCPNLPLPEPVHAAAVPVFRRHDCRHRFAPTASSPFARGACRVLCLILRPAALAHPSSRVMEVPRKRERCAVVLLGTG